MGMTPEQYFDAFVEPNYWDCLDMPADIRRAFNAAVSASHLADHYLIFHKRCSPEAVSSFSGIGEFVEFLAAETNGAFRDIRSTSNAYKHLYITEGPSARYESINSCGSIERLELPGDESFREIEEGYIELENQESRLAVVFKRRDGTNGEFLPSLEIVVKCFRGLIYPNA